MVNRLGRYRGAMTTCALALLALSCAQTTQDSTQRVPHRAWLESPGGPLPFGLGLPRPDGDSVAVLVNGAERIEMPGIGQDGHALQATLPP